MLNNNLVWMFFLKVFFLNTTCLHIFVKKQNKQTMEHGQAGGLHYPMDTK